MIIISYLLTPNVIFTNFTFNSNLAKPIYLKSNFVTAEPNIHFICNNEMKFHAPVSGLPTVVARNTMLGSNSELVVLPLVARFVQTVDAAVNASKSEGADFLIYGGGGGDLELVNQEIGNVVENVKIPIFASCVGKNMSYAEASSLLASGASGFVTNLESFGLFDDDFLCKLFDGGIANDERILDDSGSKIGEDKLVNNSNGLQSKTEVVGGFVKLEDREKQLIEMERSVLNEAIEVIKKAAPLVII
jgi:hypothetical protein